MRPTTILRQLSTVLAVVLATAGLALPAGASAPTSAGQGTPVAAAGTATSVAVGFQHSCSLTSGGGVRCWGDNEFGQLGNGTTTPDSTRAVPVTGLTAGVVQLAAGEDHTCAVTSGARARCWGSNTWGMLGDGTLTDARVPVTVIGLTGVRQVAPGGSHTCALTAPATPAGAQGRGDVWCWGLNEAGELGDGTTTPSTTPRAVVGLPRPAVDVTAGVHHTCALLDDRSVWCWGWNFFGQLGTGDGFDTRVPTRIAVPAAVDVTARLEATCATTTTGTAYCWGRTGFYVGDTQSDLRPTRVEGIGSGATAVAPGYSATCGVIGGAARCWGNSYELSGLGDGRTLSAWLPVTVRGLSTGVRAVDANYVHQCAVAAGGDVRCWGVNTHGQLGDGSRRDSGVPVTASLPATTATTTAAYGAPKRSAATPAALTTDRPWNHPARTSGPPPAAGRAPAAPTTTSSTTSAAQPAIAQITVGDSHACARTTAGATICWGSNFRGAVGVSSGSSGGSPVTPRLVPGMGYGVSWLSAGSSHTCAVQSGSVWCWGDNDHHQVSPSDSSQVDTPTRVAGISGRVVQVEAAYWSTCALTAAGAVSCWGTDYSGLGDGTSVSSATPVPVRGLTSGVTSISTGEGTCAVRSSGQLWCWGYNGNGELGNGTTTGSPVPVRVLGLPGTVTAAARGGVTCALTAGGAAPSCWGYGRSGGLGTGSQRDALTAVPVQGLGAGVTSISSGNGTCAVGSTGAVRCWGSAAYGIGNPRVYGTLVPVAVPTGPATQVDVGAFGGCVALAAGGASCWGLDNEGQLGAGLTTFVSTVPVPVAFS